MFNDIDLKWISWRYWRQIKKGVKPMSSTIKNDVSIDDIKKQLDDAQKSILILKSEKGALERKLAPDLEKKRKALREFLGWFVVIAIIPLVSSIIDATGNYIETGIWSWNKTLAILVYFIAPTILAYMRKQFSAEEKKLQELIEDLNDKLNAMKINLALYKQLLGLNKIPFTE